MYGNSTTRQNSLRLFTISRNFAKWDDWKLVRVALWRNTHAPASGGATRWIGTGCTRSRANVGYVRKYVSSGQCPFKCMMYKIAHTVVGDPWTEWLTTTKRVTRGFHAWKYIPIYSLHNIYKFSFLPRTIIDWNSLSPPQLTAPVSTLFELESPEIK